MTQKMGLMPFFQKTELESWGLPLMNGGLKNHLFLKITISRWQEENIRLQFFITGIDDQSQKVWITIYCFSQFFAKNGRRLQKKVQSFLLFQHLLLLIFLVVLHEKVCRKVKTWFVIIITSDNRIIFLLDII